jgi:putative PIN family toxin of toxin-antitoxin system
LAEIEEKLRTKFGFSPRHARLMTLFVKWQTQVVEVASVVTACRDWDDNRILAAALDAACSHLVTGDSDSLELKEFRGVQIVTPRQLLESMSTK